MSGSNAPRSTIGGLMALVLAVGLFLFLIRNPSLTGRNFLIYFYGSMIVVTSFVLPVRQFLLQRVKAEDPVIPFDPGAQGVPDHVQSSIAALVPRLSQIGFDLAGHVCTDSPGLGASFWLTLFVCGPRSQLALLTSAMVGPDRSRHAYTALSYNALFRDGTRLVPSNLGSQS